jgi:archaellum component FlaG (FlaF/FlaG flagellin family)
MGFGTVATEIIIFMAVIVIAGVLAINMNSFSQQTGDTINYQKEKTIDKISTQIAISETNYNNAVNPGKLKIYVKNIGNTAVTLNQTEVYVNGERITNSEKNITVEADTDVGNPKLWDPTELAKIEVNKNTSKGINRIKVTASNGASSEKDVAIVY